jgi:hypothetical protein
MPILNVADILDLRSVEAESFTHTYTRVPATTGPNNPWEEPTLVLGTPTSGVPCTLQYAETAIKTDTGIVTVRQQQLFIAYDDPLKVGDTIRDVTTALLPIVILAGDYQIHSVEPMADAGLIMRRALLHGARIFNAGD